MPRLCFRARRHAQTVQLVRHLYSSAKRRGTAVNVGSVRVDADPAEVPRNVRLAAGQSLSDGDVDALRRWLELHGDQEARHRRKEKEAAIAERVRREMREETLREDVFLQAARTLEEAAVELSRRVQECRKDGRAPWNTLRPSYLGIYRAWTEFAKCAQDAGVAKTTKRSEGSGPIRSADLP